MTSTLFILNDAPYGNERAYNGLRLAAALAAKEDQSVRLFLMADAVGCAKTGQKVPEGYYNVQLMLGKVLAQGRSWLVRHLHGRTRLARRGDHRRAPGAARWRSWPTGRPRPTRSWCSDAKVPSHMVPELGVIEGYFGRPWRHEDRKRVMTASARTGVLVLPLRAEGRRLPATPVA